MLEMTSVLDMSVIWSLSPVSLLKDFRKNSTIPQMTKPITTWAHSQSELESRLPKVVCLKWA